jgi:hypothetical protein
MRIKENHILVFLNEIGFKVIGKIDRYCEPSIERRNLIKVAESINTI